MDKKEEFKLFVKKNPRLIKFIKDGSMSWQKFYEIYDLYGDDNAAWKDYLSNIEVTTTSSIGVAEVVNWFKNIDLDGFQDSINSLQRVISVFQDLGVKNNNKKEEYKPRPIYKHFED